MHPTLDEVSLLLYFSLSYSRNKDNANSDSLSRPYLPLKRTFQALTPYRNPDDLSIYLIRAHGLKLSSCPIPGVGLGGLISQPDPLISGGLPFTNDYFRTHRTPLPPTHMNDPFDGHHFVSAETQRSPYAIRAHENVGLSIHDTHESKPRSWQVTLQSRPDYHTTTRSGLTASATLAPPPLCLSPPPNPGRLGSTTIDHPVFSHLTPTPSKVK